MYEVTYGSIPAACKDQDTSRSSSASNRLHGFENLEVTEAGKRLLCLVRQLLIPFSPEPGVEIGRSALGPYVHLAGRKAARLGASQVPPLSCILSNLDSACMD